MADKYSIAEAILSSIDSRLEHVMGSIDTELLLEVALDLQANPHSALSKMTDSDIGRANSAALLSSVFARAALRRIQSHILDGVPESDLPDIRFLTNCKNPGGDDRV